MGTITVIAEQSVILDSVNPYDRKTGSSATLSKRAASQPAVFFRFNMPQELKWRKILNADVYLYINTPTQGNVNIYTGSLTRTINFDTVRFADLSSEEQRRFKSSSWSNGGNYATGVLPVPGYSAQSKWASGVNIPSVTSEFLKFGLGAFTQVATEANIDTAEGAHPPYIVVDYDDNIVGIEPTEVSPAGGFIQEKQNVTFNWGYVFSDTISDEAGYLAESSFVFEWEQGSTTRTITATATGCTVPANTFPTTGTFKARVKVTNPVGDVTYSSWCTYSTDEPLSTATAVSPSNAVESDEEDVLFEWIHNNAAGTAQNGATLQWSTDGTTWQTLSTINGSSQSASISLSGKPAGTIYWRVATSNSDNVLGSYSSAVSFVFIAAPAPPAVSVNPWPRARIQWQSAEQQAYRITVDGIEEVMAFGGAKEYRLFEALPDGEHTVTVSIQGLYGLWSAPAAATFTVKNIETAGVILSGKSGIDNVLIWDDTDPYAYSREYDIYRDGELIAIVETMGNAQGASYVDKYANGKHAYKVRRIEAYYTDSNEITLYGGSCETVIGALDGEDYIPLTLTDTSDTTQTFSWRKTAVTRHFEGAEYPVIETSDFSDRYANYTVAFADLKCAEAFEALRGKTVIIKSRAREMMVGVLTEFEKRVGNFYITYSFSIQKIHTSKIDDRR